MSENKEVEIFKATHKDGQIYIGFNNKVPQAITSHALRIMGLHWDNLLISQQQPTVTPATSDIINRIRGKHG